MTTALFVGRFQPVHVGHINALEQILKECDDVIIGIGSAQKSYETDDPFTCGERIDMFRRAIKRIDPSRYLIVPLPDIGNNAIWVQYVKSMLPKFNVVYTQNPLVAELFRNGRIEVRKHNLFMGGECSGTEIRKRILENLPLDNLVPLGVLDLLDEIGGIDRVKRLGKNDQ